MNTTHKKYNFAPSKSKIELFNSNRFLGFCAVAVFAIALTVLLVIASKLG